MKRFYFFILLVSIPLFVFGQNLNNVRKKTLQIKNDTVKLDTFSIIPFSEKITVKGNRVSDSLYNISYAKASLMLSPELKHKKIQITYKTLPLDFSKEYKHRDYRAINFNSPENIKPTYGNNPNRHYKKLFTTNRLEKSGSISRGFSLGNNQNAVVNSNLNLQLSGKIGNDLNISAAITDKNIPIQPSGQTQQIQDFDKVFIKIYNKKTRLLFGDLQITSPHDGFMQYNKKLLGGSVRNTMHLNDHNKDTLTTEITGAIANGVYNQMKFTGEEANQGPYRLKGQNGELQIIILAGTEKVYIDGKLLQRGEQNDYTINYNTAELFFTPNQLITKDKRITVEYMYSTRSYARFLFTSNNRYTTPKGNIKINFYSQNDNKNQILEEGLTSKEKQMLSNISGQQNSIIIPHVDSVAFDNDHILYTKTDTLLADTVYTIYKYSTNPDSAFYDVGFAFVGAQKGNYTLSKNAANGSVYKWIAPINGVPQGSYEPIKKLNPPESQQMLTIGTTYKLLPTLKTNIEIAVSHYDLNTFSSQNDQNNTGYALDFDLQKSFLNKNKNATLVSDIGYQTINKNFTRIERFRNVEFERNWNIESINKQLEEHMINLDLSFKNKLAKINAQSDYMTRGANFTGIKNSLYTSASTTGFAVEFNGSYLNTNKLKTNTSFLRHYLTITKNLSFIKIGIHDESEDNKWHYVNDSLLNNSFFYHKYKFFITNPDTSSIDYEISYANRNDFLPFNGKMEYTSRSKDVSGSFNWTENSNQALQSTITYRELDIQNDSITDNKPEKSLIGRTNYTLQLMKGFANISTTYEISSGLTPKKEYAFLKVAPGQGVYAWSDYNNNSIKELNEFEKAVFQDQANYIRTFKQTNDYIKNRDNLFSQTVLLYPKKILKNKTWIDNFLAKFKNTSALKIQNKTTDNSPTKYLNPFLMNQNDSTFIEMQYSLRNTVSFNSKKIGLDYTYHKNIHKSLINIGHTSKQNKLNRIHLRYDILKELIFYNSYDIKIDYNKSAFFPSRNYNIYAKANKSSIKVSTGLNFSGELSYAYELKKNKLGTEKSIHHNVGSEIRYNLSSKGNILGNINYIKIDFNGNRLSSVAYNMLQGLQPGVNYTWNLLFHKKLTDVLELAFNYTGRKAKKNTAIHQGSVQLKANF